MERWLILGMVCVGTGGCRGDRPDFGNINADSSDTLSPDQTSADSGIGAVDTSSTDANAATSEATTANDGTTQTSEATTAASDDSSSSTSDASPCGEGETRECGTDVGPCSKGVQTCGEDGKWGECVGATEPAASDSCSVEGDDANCDGEPNSHCDCIGDEVEACNACGQRSCNAETGEWGPCLPVEEPRCNDAETALEVCDESGNWETQACTNPDSTNCASACATPDGVAACVVSAIDGDEDGYLSGACAAAPGDDCDDTTQSVSPGSSEVCDGRDNDCDGYTDALDSTVSLPGSPAYIFGAPSDLRRIDIAWHESEFRFLADGREMTESDPVYTSIYSGYARADGSARVIAEILASNHSDNLYDSARVVSVDGVLGAVARQDGRVFGTRFYTFDSDLDETPQMSASAGGTLGADIAQSGSGFTVVSVSPPNASHPFNTVYFASGSTDGSLATATVRDDIAGLVEQPRLAQVGSVSGMVYTDSSSAQPMTQLLRWTNGNVLGPTELGQAAQSADIASLSDDQFAIAWATAGGFRLQVRATNGTTVVCDSGEIAYGNGVLDTLDGVAVAETSLGIVVAVADSGDTVGQAAAFLFDGDCVELTQEGKALFNTSQHQNERPHAPSIAVGGGNIAFAWTAGYFDLYRSYVRVMPESMCDD